MSDLFFIVLLRCSFFSSSCSILYLKLHDIFGMYNMLFVSVSLFYVTCLSERMDHGLSLKEESESTHREAGLHSLLPTVFY